MHVQLWVDAACVRRWHSDLVVSLRRRDDTEVSVRLVDGPPASHRRGADRLFALERGLHGSHRGSSYRTGRMLLEPYLANGKPPDLVIDLVGEAPPESSRAWRVRFDGTVGIDAAIAATVHSRFPVVTIDDLRTGEQVVGGRPGGESPGVAVTSFEDVLARCTTLIHAALDGSATRATVPSRAPIPSTPGIARRGAGELASSLVHGVYRRAFRTPHWRVGWRFVDGDDVIDLGAHPADGWHDLPDDGQHFYADPFPIVVDEHTYLFVEDFDHRVGRGVISVVEFDDDGPLGTPQPVLSHDVHLSYPHVFEAGGQIWLIPETSTARRVELYRAERFPTGWVRERVLLDDVQANDVTVFTHADRWWMTATVTSGGSHSDALHLWSAPDLTGPWTPHPGNPVVVDIATARPAGGVVSRNGRLVRPVQDCTAGYGTALGLMEIVRLDDDGFEQRQVGHLTAGPRWPGRRVHTLNRAGRLECIDGSRLAPRFRVPSRGGTS